MYLQQLQQLMQQKEASDRFPSNVKLNEVEETSKENSLKDTHSMQLEASNNEVIKNSNSNRNNDNNIHKTNKDTTSTNNTSNNYYNENIVTLVKKMTLLEMKELHERERAEYLEGAFKKMKQQLQSAETRVEELSARFNEVGRVGR